MKSGPMLFHLMVPTIIIFANIVLYSYFTALLFTNFGGVRNHSNSFTI